MQHSDDQAIELESIKANRSNPKDIESKKFLLHLYRKTGLDWNTNDSFIESAMTLLSWIGINKNSVNLDQLTEKEIDLKLSQLEPRLPKDAVEVDEISLCDFTDPTDLVTPENRIISKLKNINEFESAKLLQLAKEGNATAQLLMSFVAMSKNDTQAAKIHLEQSAFAFPLAKFFLARNQLFGNERCQIKKNTENALNTLENLSKPNSFFTVLSALLLHNAFCKKIIAGHDLTPRLRLLNLVNVLENDSQRKKNELNNIHARGAQAPKSAQLSHYILEVNERYLSPIEEIPNTLSVGISQSA